MTNPVIDQMNMSSPKDTALATYALVDANQLQKSGTQVAAAACYFVLLCERFNVRPGDAFNVARNVMTDADRQLRIEFQAAKAYLENQV